MKTRIIITGVISIFLLGINLALTTNVDAQEKENKIIKCKGLGEKCTLKRNGGWEWPLKKGKDEAAITIIIPN